jgi:chemotaxis protein MotB
VQRSSRPPEPEPATTIVVRKRGHRGHGHHGGAWKVAYADFVTAMMAFFLILWLLNQTEEVKRAVGGYFRDPIAFSAASGGTGLLEGAETVAIEPHEPIEPVSAEQDEGDEAEARMREKVEEILQAMYGSPELVGLTAQIEVELTDEGLRIQLMESGDSTFFEVGGAVLSSPGVAAVRTVAQAVAALDCELVLEGHTDARPYARGGGYGNWELSSDRANAARRVLEENGVEPRRIRAVRGYADTSPRNPDDPMDERNRRISILVRERSEVTPQRSDGPVDRARSPRTAPSSTPAGTAPR